MSKSKKDYLLRTLGVQFLICLSLFLVVLGLKKSSNDAFFEIKSLVSSKLKENITFEEVKDVFSTLSNDFFTTNNSTEKTQINYNENEEAKSDTEAETVFVPFEEPSLSAEIKAEGGNDIGIKSKDDIPENVSVSKYKLSKRMVKPVIGGEVTSEFGVRTHPISNELRFHAGIDIAKPLGEPVYAAFDGTVTEATYDQWNGNFVKIKHDSDILTVYCHCQKLNVKKGQVIRAGEVIGFVGSTGNSTGPHLHFELRIKNISYNPSFALKESVSAV